MENIVECLEKLKREGYHDNLTVDNGCLYSSDKLLLPLNFCSIDRTYRIEGDSDPMHQTVIYAISCDRPRKTGVIVNSHGAYSEPDKDKIIEKINSVNSPPE
ncbi:MAG: hypothetical protein R2827_12860 [Bdellovibrionales bacterium]